MRLLKRADRGAGKRPVSAACHAYLGTEPSPQLVRKVAGRRDGAAPIRTMLTSFLARWRAVMS